MSIDFDPKTLAEILSDAEDHCNDYGGPGPRSVALGIARLTFAENGIDKVTAGVIANYMALLAADMLRVSGAGDWDFSTLIALKKIRRSDSDVETMCAPKTPRPAPVEVPAAVK